MSTPGSGSGRPGSGQHVETPLPQPQASLSPHVALFIIGSHRYIDDDGISGNRTLRTRPPQNGKNTMIGEKEKNRLTRGARLSPLSICQGRVSGTRIPP